MKNILFILLFLGAISLFAQRVDLNTASLSELQSLPITDEQARAIYDYRMFIAFFESIFDLRNIPEIDQQTLLRLRPLVTVYHFTDLDETEQRREEIDYLLERMGSQEGVQEGFSDIWEDFLMTPRNINEMHFTDILNMPNVSPIDAAAIRRRVLEGDRITDYRNLRATTGLSFYGASNLRHYIYYNEPPERQNLFINYQFRYELYPFDEDTRNMLREIVQNRNGGVRDVQHSYWGYFDLDSASPAFTNKIRVRYSNNYKAGIILFNQTGENFFTDNSISQNLEDAKYFASYEGKFNLWGRNDIKVIAGNYRVTYGEGLVIENTDYYGARQTGHGFSKRILGITEDLSRTQQFALRGIATELRREHFSAALWYSRDMKDALVYNLNNDDVIDERDKKDGKYHVFSHVISSLRFNNDDLNEAEAFFNSVLRENMGLGVRKNILDETMLGGRLEFSPFVGTQLGFTATQTLYNNAHFVVPSDFNDLRWLLIRDEAEWNKWRPADSQLAGLYSTLTDAYERNYRTVVGIDWRTVIGNTSFQGEYAELNVNGTIGKIGDDPSAIVMSTYTQFENLHFIALFRDYDVNFDNPYNRAFSEHRKMTGTILDRNLHILENQLMYDLYQNNAEPQAEKGFYFETRYRISQKWTLNRTYIDIFERKADGRRTVRFQGDVDYRPVHQLSLRGVYKHQINRYDDFADRSVSKTSEYRGIVTIFLSNRDRLQVEYRYTQVESPPYPYLTNPALPINVNPLAQGQVLMHGDFIRLDWTHNLNERLRFRNAIAYWKGNSLSHWDWEDTEIDFLGDQGIKYWFVIQNRLANNVFVSLKYRVKYYQERELFFRTWTNVELPTDAYFRNVENIENSVRLQVDWRF
ncbi:MAG: helix-hairpin-helix domain-containing protein [Candidatus Cloacimonetes bacterium]|nr:helix-hairpin-helix domain-containing protein [Candidatus Cloacimonadota bacterium]